MFLIRSVYDTMATKSVVNSVHAHKHHPQKKTKTCCGKYFILHLATIQNLHKTAESTVTVT